MSLEMFKRVVLVRDIAERGLRAGDVGVIVERYPSEAEQPRGYELEFFSASGDTVAVVSVPADAVRDATERDLLSVRELGQTP